MTDSQAADPSDRPFSRFYEQLVREAETGDAGEAEGDRDPGEAGETDRRRNGLGDLLRPKVANPRRTGED